MSMEAIDSLCYPISQKCSIYAMHIAYATANATAKRWVRKILLAITLMGAAYNWEFLIQLWALAFWE